MNLNQYLVEVNKLYQSGISSEHAYRPDFRDLINELVSDITITKNNKRGLTPLMIDQKRTVSILHLTAAPY